MITLSVINILSIEKILVPVLKQYIIAYSVFKELLFFELVKHLNSLIIICKYIKFKIL